MSAEPLPRLLVVDDEYVIRELLTVELEARGFHIETASHGQEALDAARQRSFDAVICDVQMPGLSGPQVVTALKMVQPGLEVVMVTAHASVETALASMKAGAYDYITKPLNFDELVHVLDRALHKRRLEKDLGAEQALRRELQAAYEQLSEMERLKDAFVATLSHELRTPLAIVLEGLDLLGQVPSGDAPEVASRIRSGARRMHEKVEELLAFSDLQKGQAPLSPGPLDLAALAAEVVRSQEARWRAKGLTVELDFPPGLPEAWADRERLAEVLKQLLLNAVQFNQEGGRVVISARASDKTLDVSVSDTGGGIPSEALPKVFDPFYQVAESMTRRTGGLGLGLAIVKRIVDAHGGSISAENRPEGGCLFRFSLPRRS